MVTLVTLAVAVPLLLASVQVCAGELGWVEIATAQMLPVGSWVLKVKAPVLVIVRGSLTVPLLSTRTSPVPCKPITVPPMVKLKTQDTLTVTLAAAVPGPLATGQICVGPTGSLMTV